MPKVITIENLPVIAEFYQTMIGPVSRQLPYSEFKARIQKYNFEKNLSPEVQAILSLNEVQVSPEQITQVRQTAETVGKTILLRLAQNSSITSEALEQLNTIGQIFCLRSSNKERVQIEESAEVKALFEYSRKVMDKLGFVQTIYPPADKKHYDIAIIFGGYQFRVEDRTVFWLELQKQGYSFTRVAFLGGARSLDPKQDAEALVTLLQQVPDRRVVELQQEPLNEYDMMLHVYHKLQPKDIVSPYSESIFKFNTDTVLSDLAYKQQTPKRKRDTYVLSYIGKQGVVDFLNGSGLAIQGIDRPTTASTVEDYLAFLAKQGINLQNALSVCTISMQPHTLYQAAVAEGLFPINFTIYPAGAALGITNTSDLVDNFARYVYTEFNNLRLSNTMAARVNAAIIASQQASSLQVSYAAADLISLGVSKSEAAPIIINGGSVNIPKPPLI